MPSASYGLRHPASASCLGRHARLAGRCPNNSSLFPPLAAVVVVAGHSRNSILVFGVAERLRAFRYSFFTGGVVMENGRCSAASYGSATLRTFPTIAARNKKAIVFASLHQRWLRIGAADEARTRYLHLGKVALYQMSYGRISGAFIPAPSQAILANFGVPAKACRARFCGEKEKIWYSSQKSCLQDFPMNDRIFDVVPPIGIEPMTRGFSVPCSTD